MKLVARVLQVFVPVAFLVLAIYGTARFPFAPIKRTESGYFDKLGHSTTIGEYEGFIVWERALTIAGIALMLTAFASAAHHYYTQRQKPGRNRS